MSPGKTLSDVNSSEVSIGGSQLYNTAHNYNIKKSGTITGKAAILEPLNETNILVASVDATQKRVLTSKQRHTVIPNTYGVLYFYTAALNKLNTFEKGNYTE